MAALLGLIGLVGIIYSIVAFIVSKVRNKTLKKPLRILILSIVFFITGIAISSPKSNLDPNVDNNIATGIPSSTPTPEAISTSEASPAPVATPTSTPISSLEYLKVTFLDVGQADCILIQEPNGKSMLIDAGNNADGNTVVSYLKNQGINKIDVLVGTHPHEDHIGGLDMVIDNFDIGKIYMPKVSHTTQTYEDVLTAIKNKGLKVTAPEPNTIFVIGEAKCTVLAPNNNSYDDLNNYSIVIKLEYGNTSFLFTGDAENISEQEMISKKYDLKADVLKVGHHGSSSSTTESFLNKVSPNYAIIMVGTGNDYGHPHKETMDKLKSKNITVYRTDENGTIVCTTDGQTIKFNVNPGSYTPGKKETSKDTSTPKPTAKPNTSTGNKPNPSTDNVRIVYWTDGGKSYHYTKNCPTLSRSKTIRQGTLSECPKKDPCDVCTK